MITVERRLAGRDRRAALRQGRLRGRAPLGADAGAARGETPGRGRAGRRRGRRRAAAPGQGPGELEAIAAASELADEVWRWSARARPRRPHRARRRRAPPKRGSGSSGAEPSFPAIVAAGPNGALPHAEPGEREIGAGELVVFDMGAKLDGYCSDGTRTFAVGEPERAGARGLRGRAATPSRRRSTRSGPGSAARPLDAVAREVIEAAGHGERFGHGLGHGVGLEVHEGAAALAALRGRPRGRRSGDDRARASTCRASSGSGSRTWSSSPRTATRTSAACRRSSRSSGTSG